MKSSLSDFELFRCGSISSFVGWELVSQWVRLPISEIYTNKGTVSVCVCVCVWVIFIRKSDSRIANVCLSVCPSVCPSVCLSVTKTPQPLRIAPIGFVSYISVVISIMLLLFLTKCVNKKPRIQGAWATWNSSLVKSS